MTEMEQLNISFLEKSDISEAARVLSEAMLNVPLHIAIFQGHGEKERKVIEKMFPFGVIYHAFFSVLSSNASSLDSILWHFMHSGNSSLHHLLS